ncbi:substrate-binding domain-containing protein [Sphingomonas hengshuiensis]|uniref:substrate-binding domain-containing protein n=1 Tax=Sphingomonas hengshuiensis TaxID=1609977 RepID=UPI000980DAF9|nr:substrate-binding domain-containing protein [Sphingomonas hengshuiensis]
MTVETGRRGVLSGIPIAGALLALAACSKSGSGSETGGKLGRQRSVAWAVGTPGSDFVLEISLGAADAAEMVGWKFNRILNAQPSPDAHINAIRQAITARSDVILTVDWYQAVIDEVAKGQKQGSHFAIVNSANNPDTLAPLNVPFVGQQPRDAGRMIGERIAATLKAGGVTSGSVLVGNPFPGSLNVEERILGVRDGLGSGGLRLVSFPDGSAADAATAVGLYKAKIREVGDVVAHAAAGGEMSAVPLAKALAELGETPGSILVVGTVSSLKVLNLVKSGVMRFAIDECLYYQGFFAVLLAWSMIERGMPAVSMAPGHIWVTPDNVEAMIQSYETRKKAAAAYGLS